MLDFIKSYLSYGITLLICSAYLLIDLIAFGIEEDPVIAVVRTVIYLVMSITITSLLRMQGIIHGKADASYLDTIEKYNVAINENQAEGERLQDWCELKNEMRRVGEIKKRLKYAHLSFDKFEAGEYEIPVEKQARKQFLARFSKRQIKCIEWCNSLNIELWSADYLTSDLVKDGKHQKQKNESISGYMAKSGNRNVLTSIASSLAFAFITISLARDISWANVIWSMVKVATWIASGVSALMFSFLYITTTYCDSLRNKTRALNEFKEWCANNPKPTPVVKEVEKVEEQVTPVQTLVETQ